MTTNPSQTARDQVNSGRSVGNGKVIRLLRWVLPCLVVGGLIVLVSSIGDQRTDLASVLRHSHPQSIVAAALIEVTSYLFLGWHLRLLAGRKSNVHRLAPWRVAWILFGLGSVLPAAPAEGLAMASRATRRRRLSQRRTQVVLATSQMISSTGLFLLVGMSALIVVIVGDDAPIGHRYALVAAGLTLVTLCALGGYVLSRRQVARWIYLTAVRIRSRKRPTPAHRGRADAWHASLTDALGSPWHRVLLVTTVVLAWAADGACLLLALQAVGHTVSLDVMLLAYSAGCAASMVPLLPAGVGIVETLTPALLSLYEVPFSTALSAILIYRVIGTALPALIGLLALATLRIQGPPAAPHTTPAHR